ncbi:MAG: DrmE family protein [Pirellulaceae bacterium]
MTTRLSFADRESLLSSLHRLSEDQTDARDLLERTGDWARSLRLRFGFEHALVRNVTQLANYLRLFESATDIAQIARGALCFVIGNVDDFKGQDSSDEPDELTRERLTLGQAFIASYAVHEIAVRLGKLVSYNPPAITKEEQAKAEAIFEELASADGCDEQLVASVNAVMGEIEHLSECGFLRRLSNNANTLVAVLSDPNRPTDDKVWTRGALRYLVKKDDVIGDNLGLIGYLDDLFVLQTAVDLINPLREPLVELLDEVVGVWPFLNMLSIDDGSGPRPASEFVILNSALSCRNLRSNDALNTMVISPETGPIAILIGFIATLGLAHESGRRRLTEESFAPGQKVLVDYEAVAEFDGFYDEADGRRMFRLLKRYTERGQQCQSRYSWPMSDLHRLVPVSQDRVIRGEIGRGKRNRITELSGLAFLFNGPVIAEVHAIDKRIIVVMPTTLAAEFCSSTKLYGQALKDVIPVGSISVDGDEVVRWSTGFGKQPPILLFASDLDVARQYAEEHNSQIDGNDIELIVVDVAGRTRDKHASLRRLNRLQIPCLLVTSERTANETELDQHNDLSIWEWGPDDLSALVWPESELPAECGGIAKFEHRVKATTTSRPTVESVSLPIVADTYKALLRVRRLAKQRGADALLELEEIVTEGFCVTTYLMRCTVPLSRSPSSQAVVQEQLAKIRTLSQRSTFLSEDERNAANALSDRLEAFVNQISDDNPKAVAIERLIAKYRKATILCPDARLIPEIQKSFRGRPTKIIGSVSDDHFFDDGLIIPGWFRQSRMSLALSPPIAEPIILVLYDIERRWHDQFLRNRQVMREERAQLRGRSAIYPRMNGWKPPKPPASPDVEPDTALDDIEEVRSEIDDSLKSRIYSQINANAIDTDVNARLVLFAGGGYGLFTDNYNLNVVTHLIDGSIDEEDETASVHLTKAKDVKVGDAVVFRPRSRDLIREVADELLQPGQRELSSTWQRSLKSFVDKHNLTPEVLCDRLKAAGCTSGPQAVRNWITDEDMIAPLQYKRDVEAIAEVTGDEELNSQVNAVVDAIRHVRNAHQHLAPRLIARRIRERAIEVVRQEQADQTFVHLGDDLVLVRVAEKATELVPARYASTNRLIEGELWHE